MSETEAGDALGPVGLPSLALGLRLELETQGASVPRDQDVPSPLHVVRVEDSKQSRGCERHSGLQINEDPGCQTQQGLPAGRAQRTKSSCASPLCCPSPRVGSPAECKLPRTASSLPPAAATTHLTGVSESHQGNDTGWSPLRTPVNFGGGGSFVGQLLHDPECRQEGGFSPLQHP